MNEVEDEEEVIKTDEHKVMSANILLHPNNNCIYSYLGLLMSFNS